MSGKCGEVVAVRVRLGARPGPRALLDSYMLETEGSKVMSPKERIEQVLDSIRPALRSDGGDVEFIDYDEEDGIVQVRLMGACGTCPVSTLTLKQGIERRIILAVPEVKGIHAL